MKKNNQNHCGSGDNVAGNKYVYINKDNELSDEVKVTHSDFLSYLINEFSYLPMLGTTHVLDIQKIFISLSVLPDSPTGDKINIDTRGLSVDTHMDELYHNRDNGFPYRLSMNDCISLSSILLYNNSVILGEPGAGKSTLQKHLLIDICNGKIYNGFLPLFIKLADISIYESGCIKNYLKNKYFYYYSMIEQYLLKGKAIIFFDGLDEILHGNQRILSDEVNIFSSLGNKVCISCRTSVFPRGVLSSNFKFFECVGFSLSQRRKFITNWFSETNKNINKIWKDIYENQVTNGLSRNPLLLSLIAIQYENNNNFNVSQRRIDIFLGAIEALINKKDNQICINLSFELKLSLFEFISYQMSNQKKEVLSVNALFKIIGQWQNSINNTDVMINDLYEWIIHTGIMIISSDENNNFHSIRFLHLTLQEALSANYIVKNTNPNDYIKRNFGILYREETIRLVMSLLSKESAQLLLNFFEKLTANYSSQNRSLIILIGRYISDLTYGESCPFYKNIFKKLIEFLDYYDDNDYSDLIIAISSICATKQSYLLYFIQKMSDNIKQNKLLLSYINILKLSHSEVAAKELKRMPILLNNLNGIRKERIIELSGIIINALEFSYDDDFWKNLYSKYVNKNNNEYDSYLSAIIAQSMAKVLSNSIKNAIFSKFDNSGINILDLFIILKYEDIFINNKIFSYVFSYSKDYCLCCFISSLTDVEIDLSISDVEIILSSCIGESKIASYFLYSPIIFSDTSASIILENIVADISIPNIVRCSALSNYLRLNRNNIANIIKMIDRIIDAGIEDYFIVTVNTLFFTTSSSYVECVFKIFNSTEVSDCVNFLLIKFLEANYLDSNYVLEWLSNKSLIYINNEEIYLHILLARAKNRDYFVFESLIDYYFKNISNKNETKIIAICKALTYINTEESTDVLIEILRNQNDIVIISSVITMLGTIASSKTEDFLINCLNEKNWPKNWPKEHLESKKGEQRPTDSRKLNAIVALTKKRSQKCVDELKSLASDPAESSIIRRAAHFAIKTICWDTSMFN